MAWTDPATYSADQLVSQTDLNLLRDNLKEVWHIVAEVEFNSDVAVAATPITEASPLDVVSAGAYTYKGYPIIVEFWCPGASAAGPTTGCLNLWEGSTDKGRLFPTGITTTSFGSLPLPLTRKYTPGAGSKTLKIRAWNTGANAWTVAAGAGGVGTKMPGFIRIWEKGGA